MKIGSMFSRAVVLAGLTGVIHAQTKVDLRTQAKAVDFSAASYTRPVKTGTTLPAACTAGELFFKTDAPASRNLYGCVGTNTWEALGGGQAGSSSGANIITGTADQVQLDITGYSAQTNPIMQVRKQDGTVVFRVNGDGTVDVGGGAGPEEWTLQAVPANPANGNLNLWGDATAKILKAKDNTGRVTQTIAPVLCPAGQFVTGYDERGDPVCGVSIGGGGASGPRILSFGTAAKCQSGVAGAGFSLPSSNAPTAKCDEADGIQAYLEFAAGILQRIYDRIELPADWGGTLRLRLTAYSTSTTAPTINLSIACINSGPASNPGFGFSQSVPITMQPASGRSIATKTVDVTGCSAGNLLEWRMEVTANAAGAFRLIGAQFTE